MARRPLSLAITFLVVLAPAIVQARGYGRSGGVVNTPYGTMNMNSPEWQASGGNPFMYQQLMEEKMLMQQQQMMMKQQQQYMKMMQQQAKKQKAQPQQTSPVSNVTSLSTPRKKKGRKPAGKVAKAEVAAKSKAKSKADVSAKAKKAAEPAKAAEKSDED